MSAPARFPLALLLLTSALAARAAAQRSVVPIPDLGVGFEGDSYFAVPDLHQRMQIAIDTRALATSIAVVRSVSLRPEGSPVLGSPAVSLPRVQFFAGIAAKPVGNLAPSFAANVKGTLTKLHDGRLDIGATPAGIARSFSIRLPMNAVHVHAPGQGPLLFELRVQAPKSPAGLAVDGHLQRAKGGDFRRFGQMSASNSATYFGLDGQSPSQLHPAGGTCIVRAGVVPPATPSVIFLGFSRRNWGPLHLPVDLAPFGAPGNRIHASLDLPLATFAQPVAGGVVVGSSVKLPAAPALDGAEIFFQALHLFPQQNPLGVVLSNGLSARIRSKGPQQMRTLLATKESATTGTVLADHGGPALLLHGTFQ